MAKKKFSTMADMLRSMDLGDEKLAAEHEERMAKRKLVQTLISQRLKRDISQEAMAHKMGCTQSRISKLEAGSDAELKWGEIKQYLDALGLGLNFLIGPKNLELADQVNFHALAIQSITKRIAKDKTKVSRKQTSGAKIRPEEKEEGETTIGELKLA